MNLQYSFSALMSLPKFISEKDVEMQKKRREAEGKGEEKYDHRSLYDRLQAEKHRKQEEFESSIAFKNQVHRIDEDEAKYLQTLAEVNKKKELDSEKEVEQILMEAKISFYQMICLIAASKHNSALAFQYNVYYFSEADESLEDHYLDINANNKETYAASTSPSYSQGMQAVPSRSSPPPSPPSISTATGEEDATSASTESRILVGYLPGIGNYADSPQESSSDSSESSESTDIEDAACTMSDLVDRVSRPPRKVHLNE
ncbi:unnamed protein product [Protopolystoma xenopodis]|uniref:FAM192A/Fyv6 N-terminal domain-containing protein n=1 Tax=Protopolystoma xenopodis TaxID=117903 RepID=A0A448XEX5_9PLAT|nr:unnamed protein product [Protopolystoma xenopodis]